MNGSFWHGYYFGGVVTFASVVTVARTMAEPLETPPRMLVVCAWALATIIGGVAVWLGSSDEETR